MLIDQHGQCYSDIHPITSGILQGSVLGFLLHNLYTVDTYIGTFSDDTASNNFKEHFVLNGMASSVFKKYKNPTIK